MSQLPVDSSQGTQPEAKRWENIAALIIGICFLITIIIVAISLPEPSKFQIFVFRITLALAAAAIGAIIPGFILVKFRNFVRAGGAIALFVLIYLVNPPALVVPEPPCEHEGYLGTLRQHLNALPDKEFSLLLADQELNDFWIDDVYSGKTWSDVLTKICEDPIHDCLKCDPPPGKIEDSVRISVVGGPEKLRNISTETRSKYICPGK